MALKRITDEEIFKLHEDFFGEGSSCQEIDDNDLCVKVADAQLESCEAQIPAIEQAAQGKEFSKWVKGFMDAGMAVDKPESVPLYIEVALRAAMERVFKEIEKRGTRSLYFTEEYEAFKSKLLGKGDEG